MKKAKERAKGFVAGFILAAVISSTVVLANAGVTLEAIFGVNVAVRGQTVNFAPDAQPFIANGRTYLPVRAIADALDLYVEWDAETSTVYIGGRTVSIATLLGEWRVLTAEDIFDGRTIIEEIQDVFLEFFADGIALFTEADHRELANWELLDGSTLRFFNFDDDFSDDATMHVELRGNFLVLTHEDLAFGDVFRLTLERVR